METVPVSLGPCSYTIQISRSGDDWTACLAPFLQGRSPVVLTNPKVRRLCGPTLEKGLGRQNIRARFLSLPDGERFKTLATVAKAYRGLLKLGVDRSTPILLLGGGGVGDLGGFVAATFLRGLSFVHVGTTLVAQVDSSIGGKLGVDLPEGKNLVGVFGQPKAVLSHVPFLKTLPKREITGGLGEVVKYGVIADPQLLGLVMDRQDDILRGDEDVLSEIVRRSSAIKARVVSEDERESSRRMILNFGHTFGHALERLTRYRAYHHGEAIAVGMAIAAELSHRMGFCGPAEAGALVEAIRKTGLPTHIPTFSRAQWVRALEVDKKSRDGKIHFVFMKKIGEVVASPVSAADLVMEMKREMKT